MENFNLTNANRWKTIFWFLCITLMISLSGFAQNVGINSTGNPPNPSAGLDIDFPDRGLLIPRVSLTNSSSFAPLSAHVAGMVVYNTATAGDVTPGFYYNDGLKWISGFPNGNAIGDMLYWTGSAWNLLPVGTVGQYLTLNASNIPTWTTASVGGVYATLTTTAASAITTITATSGGNVVSDGGSVVVQRGVCWNTIGSPTIADTKTINASGLGIFSSSLTGLLSGTTYYIRSYAINSSVVSYGDEITFTTLANIPTLAATTAASAITGNSANTGGNVTADGGAPILERGVCYAKTANPTLTTTGVIKVVDSFTTTGSFVSYLTGLFGGTLYYVRAYATNSQGTAYGTQISFTTTVVPPTLATIAATNISGGSAASGGSMNWNGGGYQNYDDYGVAYSTSPVATPPTYIETVPAAYPHIATNTANVSVNPLVNIAPWVTNLIGLAANTTYYIRSYLNLYRSSPAGWITVYGPEISFTTTAPTAPVVGTTTAATLITGSTVRTGGAIISDGGSAITAKGVCWGTSPSPTLGAGNYTTDGAGTASFVSNPTGLSGSTTYYIRAYATNAVGTSYCTTDQAFTTCVASAYKVGDFAGGGRVFYVNCDGSGLIAALGDQPTTAVWGCSGTSIVTSTALGSGAANTAAILAGCADRPIAASLASSCTDGGYNDWYLPSQAELGLLINSGYVFGVQVSYYCSSSQSSSIYVSGYYYANNWQASGLAKTTQFKVRAIRSFGAPSLPSVTTGSISNIAGSNATGGGNVTSDGGSSVSAGVCWSTTTGPTIADSHTTDANAAGTFVSNLSGLSSSTTYYVRAYATNGAGTAYGSEVSFTTSSPTASILTTAPITNQTSTSGTSGGTIVSNGGSAVFVSGICWSINTGPTTADSKTTDGTTSGTFSSIATGLTTGITYYIRAYATNSINTSYGNEIAFAPGLPTVIADVTSIISAGSIASIYSYVSSDAGDPVTETGLCWSTTTGPTTAGTHTTDPAASYYFTSNLNNLTVGVTYYVRAYAINSAGTAYSEEISFIATAATVGQYLTFSTGYDGVIISTDGTNGLIATAWEFGVSDWACPASSTGASGTIVGTGLSNTTAILADITLNGCVSASINSWYSLFAAQVPGSIIGPGWYLPSRDEVDLIYSTSATTGLVLTGLQLWSSSEVDATHAWSFNGAIWQNSLKTDDTKTIWPIRSF